MKPIKERWRCPRCGLRIISLLEWHDATSSVNPVADGVVVQPCGCPIPLALGRALAIA